MIGCGINFIGLDLWISIVLGLEHCNGGDGSKFSIGFLNSSIADWLLAAWVTGATSQSGIFPAKNSTNYSLLYSLIDWVENTTSSGPETMIGTKYIGDVASAGVEFTRPYCRWPNIPVYDGKGNVNLADS